MDDSYRAENLCEAVLEQASDGIFLADATTRYVLVNDQACRMLGYTREELLQLYMRDLVAPEDLADTPMRFDELRAGKTVFSERHFVRKDGTRVLVALSGKMLADGHFQAIARDITQRKQAERHIRKVDRAYALLSDANQAIVRIRERQVLFDRICEIAVQVSDFRMAWIGLVDGTSQRTDVVAKAGGSERYFEQLVVSLQHGDPPYNPAQRALKSGQHTTCNRIGPDIPLEPCQDLEIQLGIRSSAAFPLIVSGKVRGILNFYSDQPDVFDDDEIKLLDELATGVSFAIEFGDEDDKRHRAEKALADSEERFRATFEQAAVGIAHVAPDGRWLQVNQRLCDIVGYTRAELLERTFQDITYPDDLVTDVAYVQQMLATQIQSYAMEKRYICKDGHLVWVNLTVSLVRNADGSPDYFISVVEDISSRKQTEEQIRSLAKFPVENPSPVIRLRQDGLILYANDASHWLLEKWHCTVGSYVPEFWRDLVTAALLSHSVLTHEIQYRDEAWSFWLAPVVQEAYANLQGRDVTQGELAARKQAELAAIVEFSDDAIIGKTLDGIVTSWNIGAAQIYGYTQGDTPAKSEAKRFLTKLWQESKTSVP